MRLPFASTVSIALALAAMSSTALAAEKQTPAAGACKSALPVFDGNIRNRPLAVQNEGTSSAFVTCAQQGDFDELPTHIDINLINLNAMAVTVNCTMVSGSLSPAYYTSSTLVPAGAINHHVEFAPSGAAFNSPNHAFSCSLPPGAGISRIGIRHD